MAHTDWQDTGVDDLMPSTVRAFTAQEIIDAVEQAHGLISVAAGYLDCDPKTIRNYAQRYPTVAAAIRETKEKMNDFVEGKMFQAIRDGDTTMMIFYAKTQMKHRGYVERSEVTGADNNEIIFKIVYGNKRITDSST